MGFASVQKDIAPLYATPSLENPRYDEALYGMTVQVMEESPNGWSFVRTEHNTRGYVPTVCLNTNADIAVAWKKYKKSVVLAPYIDVLRSPNFEATRILSVPRGGLVVALGVDAPGGWRKVGLADGTLGYTRASYIGDVIEDWSLLREDDMRWNIVESALAYNGTSWRTGGRTPLGVDAVGLVAMAYLLNGVVVPREFFFVEGYALHSIKPAQMEEGDVIYFPDSVGIYMGEDRFVHATRTQGSEGVIVNSLNPHDEDYRSDLADNIMGAASLF